MVALHYPSISFRLACFYHLVLVVGDEKLKAVLQVWIRQGLKKCQMVRLSTPSPAGGAVLTGFLSSTSLMLRFSSGMIPLGSLSWINARTTTECWRGSLGCRDNPNGTHRGVLKVVEAVVGEDEPPPLPGFDPSACGAQSQRQSSSAREAKRDEHRGTRASSGRQTEGRTDVRADRQMCG